MIAHNNLKKGDEKTDENKKINALDSYRLWVE